MGVRSGTVAMRSQSRLGQVRFDSGFTSIEAAAKKLGCSRIHLAEIERGAGAPSNELLHKMCRLYHSFPGKLLAAMLEDQRDYHKRAQKRLA